MRNFEDTFKELLGRYLKRYYGCDVAQVLSYVEDEYQTGYCDTCWSEETVVYVDYLDSSGERKKQKVWDSMVNLLDALIELDKEAE